MRRRLNADDFRRTTGSGTGLERGTWWSVADDYELRDGDIVAKFQLDEDGILMSRGYSPLEDEPDLFLKFARLFSEPDFEAAALEWCRRYGLPGASAPENYKRPPDIFMSDDDRRMPISTFREEAAEARRVLLMYEAVLNRDEKAALTLMHPEDVAYLRSSGIAERELGRRALEHALHSASWRVTLVIHDYCAPKLVPTDAHSLEVKSYWNFYNLLGAMYLQMFWLMASGENVARCEYCGQIISLARPHPEGRKRRSDKRFCDAACRQGQHRSKKQAEDNPT